MYLTTWSIDIQRYIARTVARRKEKKLSCDDIGNIVINRNTKENDPVHHQTAEHIHRRYIQLSFLYDGRIDITVKN